MAVALALRQIRVPTQASAIIPLLFRQSVRCCSITGPIHSASDADHMLDDDMPIMRKPRRRWISVADLVTEVEQAIVKGVPLRKDGPTFDNLSTETARLREDNDRLRVTVRMLKEERGLYVEEEEKITATLKQDADLETFNEAVEVTKKIQTIDFELAALRNQNKRNITDIGHLKLVKSRIENISDIKALVEEVEEALKHGEILAEDGPQALELKEVVLRLRDEYDRVMPKITAYGDARRDLNLELQALENKIREAGKRPFEYDQIRHEIVSKLQQDKRMMSQLDRLRQLQIMNKDYTGLLERARAKLKRNAIVHRLLAEGDAEQIKEKVKEFDADLTNLRSQIKDIESRLDEHAEEGHAVVERLRILKDSFTSESGKQRELLIANIHQEERWKSRLAVLRGEKMQKLRFICLLQEALVAE